MAWPATFSAPTREGLVLVPSASALMQDLGPFRSGRYFETDLLPHSALICAGRDGLPVVDAEGFVQFAFEGNAVGAVNMERFHERCLVAAGRLATRAPSVAFGCARPAELHVVAHYDLLSYEFVDVLDQKALEAWSGEETRSYLPPADLQTPCSDPDLTAALCKLPMSPIGRGQNGVYLWKMVDGTILSKEPDAPLVAWRRGDEGLVSLLVRAGVGPSQQILLSSPRT